MKKKCNDIFLSLASFFLPVTDFLGGEYKCRMFSVNLVQAKIICVSCLDIASC